MKAFRESARKPFDAAGLILLFAEKLAALTSGRDEHSQTVILTPDFKPCSRLPIRSWHKPDSGLGELVIRYSGATVPDFHGVPGT